MSGDAKLPPPVPEPRIVAAPNPLAWHDVPAHLANYSRVFRHPSLIVLHATDGCEGVTKDTDCAAMFAAPFLEGETKRSAHYVIDANSVTHCVRDEFVAWHCGHQGNTIGIGIELCGRADQTRAQWLDALSLPMLCIAARLCADLCHVWSIPVRVVNDRGLLAGAAGITTHSFVSMAWRETDHHDPGPGFPLGAFVTAVAQAEPSFRNA
jgi:N-acetyl-anhydromuramyl-L-alanine amidase AmpD